MTHTVRMMTRFSKSTNKYVIKKMKKSKICSQGAVGKPTRMNSLMLVKFPFHIVASPKDRRFNANIKKSNSKIQ